MERIQIVNSSSIKTVGYSPETATLEVEFSSGGLYSYANVPQEVYDRFLTSDSKGHFFQADIRACYPCTHLNPKPKEESHGEEEKKAKATPEVESKSVQKRKAAQIKTKPKARKRIS